MFLLIRKSRVKDGSREVTLHSNMFLLIHDLGAERSTEYMPLHSNMFLLIRCRLSGSERPRLTFTFQYVSINTIVLRDFTGRFLSLHSNMFLLIPIRFSLSLLYSSFTFQYVSINTAKTLHKFLNIILYIPICFY